MAPPDQPVGTDRLPPDRLETLVPRFRRVRGDTEALAAPLSPEDQVVQSMPDASPVKWHRAHTTWFFETFLLQRFRPGYAVFDPAFGFLFNSYYEAVGARHPRPERGMITRPSVAEVGAYRGHVDAAMVDLLADPPAPHAAEIAALVELGLHHEQQHQELVLTDLLHLLAQNPVGPVYRPYRTADAGTGAGGERRWHEVPGGIVPVGHDGTGFAYDNEGPRHEVLLRPFRLASHPVTNADWLGFMEDGGYRRPELWLSDGWATVQAEGWQAPGYWREEETGWRSMTLAGRRPIEPAAPVCHVSFYEADAFARWAGARLPSEAEWEIAAACQPVRGNTVGSGFLRPLVGPPAGDAPRQLFGDVWEWTQSPYGPYPGYRPPAGAVGEYNGKFMCNQMVLRGGSCATPDGHVRATYRNFFYPQQRWQFSGLRLAEDA